MNLHCIHDQRGGSRRALNQAIDIQKAIVETHKQAKAWESAAAAQLKLQELRNGEIPALPDEQGVTDDSEDNASDDDDSDNSEQSSPVTARINQNLSTFGSSMSARFSGLKAAMNDALNAEKD